MLHRNEYPTVERVDRLVEGACCDSIGPQNEFWFVSVIENAGFALLSSLLSPGPEVGGWGVSFTAFVSWSFPSSATNLLLLPLHLSLFTQEEGVLGSLCFVFCFAEKLMERGWEIRKRLKGNRIKGSFCHAENLHNVILDLGWHITRIGSTLEIGPTSG